MSRTRMIVGGVLLAALLGLGLMISRGDRLERRLLRMGGGVVANLAQRPGRTAGWFAVVLGAAWVGVAAASLSQPRR